MTTESYSVPVSLLRQYRFCPRIVYFCEVMGIKPQAPIWVAQGVAQHERQIMLERRRVLSRFGLEDASRLFNVELKSERLLMHGVADAILLTSETVYVLEFKPNATKISYGHIVQAMAYGFIAEEQFEKKLGGVHILYGPKGKTQSTCDVERWREPVLEEIRNLHVLLVSDTMPSSAAEAGKCCQCEYLNFCNDRDWDIEYK